MDKNNALIKRLLNLKEDYTLDLNEGEDKDTLKVLPEKEVVEKDSPQEILLAKLMAQFINGELSADEFVQKEKEVKSMASLEEDDVDTERDPDEGDDNETSDYTDGEEGEGSKETPKEGSEESSEEGTEGNAEEGAEETSEENSNGTPEEGRDVAPNSVSAPPREVTLESVTKDVDTLSLEDKSKLLIDLYNRGGDRLKDAIHKQVSNAGEGSKAIEDMYHAMQGGTTGAALNRAYDSFVNSKNNTSRISIMAEMFDAIHAATMEDEEAAKAKETPQSSEETQPTEETPSEETSNEETTETNTNEESTASKENNEE